MSKIFVIPDVHLKPGMFEGNLITLDTFSTYRDGTPFGDQRFVWVDTVRRSWHYAED